MALSSVMRVIYIYIKRNVEKVWGARYISKNTVISLHIRTGWCNILDFGAAMKTVTVINQWCSILDFGAAMKTVTVINQQVWICQYNGIYILFVQIRIQDYEISSGS
jgi:hypothetical protein